MSKRVFHVIVTAEFSMAVYAESENEARSIARDNARDELDNQPNTIACAVTSAPLPFAWRPAVPYGGDGSMTVAELLEAARK